MLIELKWLDAPNNHRSYTEIWRSSDPFGDTTMATLIATLDPGISTYADVDVTQGNKYYYRFRKVIGDLKSSLSKQFEFEANQYTGPGPTRTVFGDEHFGYYGLFPVDPEVTPTINKLRELFGLTLVNSEVNSAPMHKFAVGGTVRGIHTVPLALGNEISIDNPLLQKLMDGESIEVELGLHRWRVILPSAEHAHNTEHDIQHFPGELRSMLGVVSEMYSRVEDAETGNTTGDRLTLESGRVLFYDPLIERYPSMDIKWITSSDWDNQTAVSINWTGPDGPPPLRPKELHVETVDYTTSGNWDKTLVWPVVVYTGLIGPKS